MSKKTSETLNELFKKYNLVYDEENKKDSDVFITRNFKIITRSGVQKIQAALKIKGSYDVVYVDPYMVALKGKFSDQHGNDIETFGEATIDRVEVVKTAVSGTKVNDDGSTVTKTQESVETVLLVKGNVQQQPAYIFAMAEKRALSRAVLTLAGLYQENFYSEDEADDFAKEVRRQRSS